MLTMNDNGGDLVPEQRQIDLSCVDCDIRSGMTLEEASRQYGLPEPELRERLQAAGLATAAPNGRTYDKLKEPDKPRPKVSLAQIRVDQAAGLSYQAIAQKRGCSADRVYRLLKAAAKNGCKPSGGANGKPTLPEVQPEPDDAQRSAKRDGKDHAEDGELQELDQIIAGHWSALSRSQRLRLLLETSARA